MMKHTPGPWLLDYQDAHDKRRHVMSAACEFPHTIAEIELEPSKQIAEANARLIAAAPELLEALREIANDYAGRFDMDSPSTNPGMKYVVQQARAAIAKATGAA